MLWTTSAGSGSLDRLTRDRLRLRLWTTAQISLPAFNRNRLASVERLSEDQLSALKAWGEGLAQVGQAEMQAAGRAIQLLIQEIEALHIELWHQRIDREPEHDEPAPADQALPQGRHLVGALVDRVRAMTHALRPD
jgi:hypothetical protein